MGCWNLKILLHWNLRILLGWNLMIQNLKILLRWNLRILIPILPCWNPIPRFLSRLDPIPRFLPHRDPRSQSLWDPTHPRAHAIWDPRFLIQILEKRSSPLRSNFFRAALYGLRPRRRPLSPEAAQSYVSDSVTLTKSMKDCTLLSQATTLLR